MSTMLVGTLLAATGALAQAATQAATRAATQPALDIGRLFGAIILGAMFVGLGVFIAIRAWDPSRVCGPIRYALDRPATAPVLLAVLAGGVYLGAQIVAVMVLVFLKLWAGEKFDAGTMSPANFAVIATVPGILAALALLLVPAFDRAVGPQLGITLRHVPRGVMLGVVGAAVAVPLVFGSSVVFELMYRRLNYTHPQEHELLAMMRDADSLLVRVALIAGAVIVAPLVEELVFRGFIQSALVRLFSRRAHVLPPAPLPWPSPAGPPETPATPPVVGGPLPLPPAAAAPMPVLPYAGPYTTPYMLPAPFAPVQPPTAFARWMAVILTSIVFALLHPPWSWPMIFLLSLCLGYAYERTGNLWSSVTIHLLFNLTSTAVFLSLRM